MPLFNRMLRYSREVVIARQVENPDGYLVVNLETVNEIEISNLEEIVGVFRSKKQAQNVLDSMREKYHLCPKLLGLEKGKGSCFQYQLGNCQGACVEKELPLRYNLRVVQAFANLKIKRWPFGGPVVIKEKNEDLEATHVVYQWCYLGKIVDGDEIPSVMPKSFDYDTYKILVKWILEEKGMVEELGQKRFENQQLGFLENEVEYDREYYG